MYTPLKIVSVNIEGNNHWDTLLPFLEREQPDVVCVQEIFKDQLALLQTYPNQHYSENTQRPYWGDAGGALRSFGTAIVSRHTLHNQRDLFYWKPSTTVPTFVSGTPDEKHETHWYGCAAAEIEIEGARFKILTTQFTWTSDGMPDAHQRADLAKLLDILHTEGEYVLCGDFNIPRVQNPLYKELTSIHTDHIPVEYTCSLDPLYHRTHNTPAWDAVQHYMVDYLLTTPAYTATNVRLESGVSDHKAIVATLHLR